MYDCCEIHRNAHMYFYVSDDIYSFPNKQMKNSHRKMVQSSYNVPFKHVNKYLKSAVKTHINAISLRITSIQISNYAMRNKT